MKEKLHFLTTYVYTHVLRIINLASNRSGQETSLDSVFMQVISRKLDIFTSKANHVHTGLNYIGLIKTSTTSSVNIFDARKRV